MLCITRGPHTMTARSLVGAVFCLAVLAPALAVEQQHTSSATQHASEQIGALASTSS